MRVFVYFEYQTQCATSRGCENGPPRGEVVDLGKPSSFDSYIWIRMLRSYQRYFNDRFQTYNRSVRFFAMVNTGTTAEARRADAVRAAELRPFAAIAYGGQNADAFVTGLASDGVLSFPGSDGFSAIGYPESFFRQFPGRVWSYLPSLEHRARLFTSYVCKKVIPHSVSFSGINSDLGNPRRLGLLSSSNATRPDLQHFSKLVRSGIEGCGGGFVTEGTFLTDQSLGQPDPGAAPTMARFEQEGVTTIIWAGGLSQDITRAAAANDYRPEIVVAGDGLVDGTSQGQLFMDQSVWEHARAVTTYTLQPAPRSRVCVTSGLESEPSENPSDLDRFGCRWYPDLRQLFIGIQVAGPRLTVETMDKGFHAIRDVNSTDPQIPACFYRSGDYSCVKDAAVVWWDREGVNRNNTVGCWRMMQGGLRYLQGNWPSGDVEAQKTTDDPCNLQNFHPVG